MEALLGSAGCVACVTRHDQVRRCRHPPPSVTSVRRAGHGQAWRPGCGGPGSPRPPTRSHGVRHRPRRDAGACVPSRVTTCPSGSRSRPSPRACGRIVPRSSSRVDEAVPAAGRAPAPGPVQLMTASYACRSSASMVRTRSRAECCIAATKSARSGEIRCRSRSQVRATSATKRSWSSSSSAFHTSLAAARSESRTSRQSPPSACFCATRCSTWPSRASSEVTSGSNVSCSGIERAPVRRRQPAAPRRPR